MMVKRKLFTCLSCTALVLAGSLTAAGPASGQSVGQSVPVPKVEVPGNGDGSVTFLNQEIPIQARAAQFVGGEGSAVSFLASRTGQTSDIKTGFSAQSGELKLTKNPENINCTKGIPVLAVEYVSYDTTYAVQFGAVLLTNIPSLDEADGSLDGALRLTSGNLSHTTNGGATSVLKVCLPTIG